MIAALGSIKQPVNNSMQFSSNSNEKCDVAKEDMDSAIRTGILSAVSIQPMAVAQLMIKSTMDDVIPASQNWL